MYPYTLPVGPRKNKGYWLCTIVPLVAFNRLLTSKTTNKQKLA